MKLVSIIGSEGVDHGAECRVDFFEGTVTLDGVAEAFVFVPLDEGRSLVVIDGEALADGLFVVVGTAAGLTAVDETFHQHFVGHTEFEHGVHLRSALSEHLFEGFGLGDGAGKTVEDDTGFLGEGIVGGGEDVDHEFIGDELTVVDVAFGGATQFGVGLDFGAQHVAGGDVVETVFFNQNIALGAFARTGGTEDDEILHGCCMCLNKVFKLNGALASGDLGEGAGAELGQADLQR